MKRNCKHIKLNKIGRYGEIFKSDFSNNHKFFVGVCTRVQFQNIATKLSAEEREKLKEELGAFAEKMEGTERRIKLNLEDDTDFIMAMSTPAQYEALDENKVKEGMIFLVAGRSVGDFRISTSVFLNMTDLMEKVETGGTLMLDSADEWWVVNDPFKVYREYLEDQSKFSLIPTTDGDYRLVVYVIDIHDRITKKNKEMATIVGMDWRGNVVDLLLWPDDYKKYRKFFEKNKVVAVHINVWTKNGKSRHAVNPNSPGKKKRIMNFAEYYQQL
jgi:hypothetical protein